MKSIQTVCVRHEPWRRLRPLGMALWVLSAALMATATTRCLQHSFLSEPAARAAQDVQILEQ